MIFHIAGLLTAKQLAEIEAVSRTATFADGMQTAGPFVAEIKRNAEVKDNSEAEARLNALLMAVLQRHHSFQMIAQPRRIGRLIFSRYTEGMYYGDHSDNAVMNPAEPLRTDLAMTVFLSPPGDYEGGELVLDTDMQPQSYKLPAGDAVIYPTFLLHRVNPVTKGERRVAVTWIQSRVRLPQHRQILIDLSQTISFFLEHTKEGKQHPEAVRLDKVYKNLARLWTEL